MAGSIEGGLSRRKERNQISTARASATVAAIPSALRIARSGTTSLSVSKPGDSAVVVQRNATALSSVLAVWDNAAHQLGGGKGASTLCASSCCAFT